MIQYYINAVRQLFFDNTFKSYIDYIIKNCCCDECLKYLEDNNIEKFLQCLGYANPQIIIGIPDINLISQNNTGAYPTVSFNIANGGVEVGRWGYYD